MNKFAALVWLTAVAIAALGLYHMKYEVQRLEADLGIEHQSILKHQEAIHILKAEWSYLNQPARISDLAKRHLGLAPLTAIPISASRASPPVVKRAASRSGCGAVAARRPPACLAARSSSARPASVSPKLG